MFEDISDWFNFQSKVTGVEVCYNGPGKKQTTGFTKWNFFSPVELNKWMNNFSMMLSSCMFVSRIWVQTFQSMKSVKLDD